MLDAPGSSPASFVPPAPDRGSDTLEVSAGTPSDAMGRVASDESRERDAAWVRARARRHTGAAAHAPAVRVLDRDLAHRAFSALAENVRDYAIFLMDREGIIRYWGEGAHLMKRWTREQTEGGHLRMLYPDGGSEDGTAEDHLRDAATDGQYVGQGRRMRGDGSMFWAHVTLTALTGDDGVVLGFAKVTRDLTEEHTAQTAVALGVRTRELDAVRGEQASLIAELDLLKEEVAVLSQALGDHEAPENA